MAMDHARRREFSLSEGEFNEIRALVRTHTGIALAPSKRELVYGRLVRRLRRLKLDTFRAYIGLLERGEAAELEQFTNAITTNLTSFFRESHHFDYLRETVLAELEVRNSATRRIRVWCAGCSTGEEAYSVAMVLAEAGARFRGWDVRVLATDLDSHVLAVAEAGVYGAERLAKLPPAARARWFTGSAGGQSVACPQLKSLVAFRRLNLVREWPFSGPFDVILCRNVVIYFDRQTQCELFARMAAQQRAGDHLFVGHSESLFKLSDRYQLIGRTIYRRLE